MPGSAALGKQLTHKSISPSHVGKKIMHSVGM